MKSRLFFFSPKFSLFSENVGLEYIDLSNVAVGEITEDAFSRNLKLSHLLLRGNEITDLQLRVSKLMKYRKLKAILRFGILHKFDF